MYGWAVTWSLDKYLIDDEPQLADFVSLRGWTMELIAQSVHHGNAKKQFQPALFDARHKWGLSCI